MALSGVTPRRLLWQVGFLVLAALRWGHAGDTLTQGEILRQDECLSDSTGTYHLCLRKGQLVLHQGIDTRTAQEVVWQSPKQGSGTFSASVDNGSLVVYKEGKNREAVWSTESENGSYLRVERDGRLVLNWGGFLSDTTVWDSATKKKAADTEKSGADGGVSKVVTEPATGITFPRTLDIGSAKGLYLLGAGVRAKALVVANVNVYAVGLYVDPKAASKPLKKYSSASPTSLAKDSSFYNALLEPGYTKYLHLIFARSVGSSKVVDALTAVQGVSKETVDSFSSILLEAVGSKVNTGDTVSLGWEGKDTVVVVVRGKKAGAVEDPNLPKALFELYLGSKPVSPPAKAAFAEGVQGLGQVA